VWKWADKYTLEAYTDEELEAEIEYFQHWAQVYARFGRHPFTWEKLDAALKQAGMSREASAEMIGEEMGCGSLDVKVNAKGVIGDTVSFSDYFIETLDDMRKAIGTSKPPAGSQ